MLSKETQNRLDTDKPE